jgi:non-specific serine/threonine protein kinase
LALPGIFGSYDKFRRAFREGDERLLFRARPFVLRRSKTEILKELPPKNEQDVYLDMTEEQKEIYTRVVGEVRAEVLEAYRNKPQQQAGIVALAALLRLRQVCVSPELLGRPTRQPAPKIAELLVRLEELREEGHATLVFSQFTRALDAFEKEAQKENLPFLRMDGKTPTQKRKKLVKEFQESAEPLVFLVSLKTGGVGLNLTRATYVFHLDPWWNPAVENQASDRVHRIGQRNPVFIQRLLMRHTVEEKMMILKKRKQALFDQIMGISEARGKSGAIVTKADFEFLIG